MEDPWLSADSALEEDWSAEEPFLIETAAYAGPLDLLLTLIHQKKQDIFSISLAEICQSYLDALAARKALNLSTGSDFIKLAADLIYIKSKSLLPSHENDASPDLEEEPANLEARLKERLAEYEKFRKASISLDQKDRLFRDFFSRQLAFESLNFDKLAPWIKNPAPEEQFFIHFHNLVKSYEAVLERKKLKAPYAWEEKTWDIEQAIEKLQDFFREHRQCLFSALISRDPYVSEVVSQFFAVLELGKQQWITTEQTSLFADFACKAREKLPEKNQAPTEPQERL